jgi:hypothetical protein
MVWVWQLDPDIVISVLPYVFPLRRPEDRTRWEEGLRRAGLLE